MLVSIVVHLTVVWYEMREGRRLHSDVLVADALHNSSYIKEGLHVARGEKAGGPHPPLLRHRQELEREIADLKARWPKHSVPPAMLIRLEELEEELERLLRPFDGSTELAEVSAQGGLRPGQVRE